MEQDRLGSLPSEASSPERCQDHEGCESSPLGRGRGLHQEQQDGANHKPHNVSSEEISCRNGCVEFPEADLDDDGTGFCKATVGTSS